VRTFCTRLSGGAAGNWPKAEGVLKWIFKQFVVAVVPYIVDRDHGALAECMLHLQIPFEVFGVLQTADDVVQIGGGAARGAAPRKSPTVPPLWNVL